MTIKIAEIDNEIKAKIIADREKDYGDIMIWEYIITWHLNYTKKRLPKRIKHDKIHKNQKRRV
jgi:hypothetical protein